MSDKLTVGNAVALSDKPCFVNGVHYNERCRWHREEDVTPDIGDLKSAVVTAAIAYVRAMKENEESEEFDEAKCEAAVSTEMELIAAVEKLENLK